MFLSSSFAGVIWDVTQALCDDPCVTSLLTPAKESTDEADRHKNPLTELLVSSSSECRGFKTKVKSRNLQKA